MTGTPEKGWLGRFGQVFTLAALLVSVSVGVLIWSAYRLMAAVDGSGDALSPEDRVEVYQSVFNQLATLVAAWVGAIIAFYFSRENIAAVQSGYVDALRSVSGEARLQTIAAGDKMIPYDDIEVVELKTSTVQGRRVVENTIGDLMAIADHGRTRFPVVNAEGAFEYIVHRSLLFEFIAKNRDKIGPGQSENDLRLSDLVGQFDAAVTSAAFVPLGATVADAKAAMERRGPMCQDVFITKTGGRRDPIIGWLPHTLIGHLSRA